MLFTLSKEKVVQILVSIAVLAFGIFTLEEEFLYDFLYLFLIPICFLLVLTDKNMFGGVFFFLICKTLLLLLFHLTDIIPLVPYKVALYGSLVYILITLKPNYIYYPILIITCLSMAAEIYCAAFLNSTTNVYWPLTTVLWAICTQAAIDLRQHIMITIGEKEIDVGRKSTKLDTALSNTLYIVIGWELLQACEYLARNALNIDSTVAYYAHSYAVHFIGLIFLATILSHSINMTMHKYLKA